MNVRLPLFDLLRRRAALAACFAAVVALAGCAVTRTSPVKETFLLDPPAPAAVARAQPGTLRVDGVNVAAPFRGKAFVFRVSELEYQSDFYHEFIVAPAANIGEATARGLQRAGTFTRVTAPGMPVDADWVLEGFVTALYGDLRDTSRPAAEVAITYYLSRADGGSGVPVWSREYAQRVPLAATSAAAYAAALNTALGQIIGELSRDLAAADLPKR
jgi:cholesterol transport system auxiliary component